MSGLYGLLFGVNPLAGPLLAELGVTNLDMVPRFRDCFINEKDEVVIFTRTGGGNRRDHQEENEALRKLSGFLRDEDDTTDATYAHFCYALPQKVRDQLDLIKEKGLTVDMAARWRQMFQHLERMG